VQRFLLASLIYALSKFKGKTPPRLNGMGLELRFIALGKLMDKSSKPQSGRLFSDSINSIRT
jgi:hypothetical protein